MSMPESTVVQRCPPVQSWSWQQGLRQVPPAHRPEAHSAEGALPEVQGMPSAWAPTWALTQVVVVKKPDPDCPSTWLQR